MSNQPWSADRYLDAGRVRAILATRFPDLPVREVRYLAEGWDSQAFEVDGIWIFRFPKRADIQKDLEVEVALLPHLAAHLSRTPGRPRIPVFDFVGEPSDLFPYRFAGYRKLIGTQAHEVAPESVPLDRLAAHLGRALADLHAFPAERARALGVPENMASRHLTVMRDRALALLPSAAAALGPELHGRVIRALATGHTPPEYAGPRVLVHNDLLEEHLLLDGGGELVGIIDWGDVALGDPAVDFAGIHAWLGEAATRQVLAAHRGPLDAGVLERARYRALCLGVYLVIFGALESDPVDLARGQRALALALPAA